MSLTNKLIILAEQLDALELTKDASVLDQIMIKAARGEDFGDLLKLWDARVELENEKDDAPRSSALVREDMDIPEPTDEDPEKPGHEEWKMRGAEGVPLESVEHPADLKSYRLDELKRRHQLLKLKKMLEQMEPDEEKVPEEAAEPINSDEIEVALTGGYPEDAFEDEDNSSLMNNTDDDPFDDQLLQDEPGDEPYKGLSLKKKLKERPLYIEPEQMSDEELQELRAQENKKEELTDKVNALIEWHQKTDGLVEDPRSARKIEAELRLEIEDALEDDIIDEDYAKLLRKGLDEWQMVAEVENDADDSLIDELKEQLKGAPDLAMKLLTLIKDNPQLLALLAL